MFLLAGIVLFAQQRMSPELLWDLGRVSLEDVSPDGKSFIYGVTRYEVMDNKGNRDLYMMDTKGGEAVQLTDMAGSEHSAQFLRKGEMVGFVHGGQYYIKNLKDGEVKKLTDIDGGLHNVSAYELEDGRIALLCSRSVKLGKTTEEIYPELSQANALVIDDLMYRHWDSWSDAYYEHVGITYITADMTPVSDWQDLMEGEMFDSPLNPFGGGESFTLSPDGMQVIYECKKKSGVEWAVSTNSDLYKVYLKDMTTINLTDGLSGYDKNPVFSPDGKYLAWLSMKKDGYESDVNDLVIMEMSSGEMIHVLQAAGKYDDYTINSFSWDGSNTIFAGIPLDGTNQIFRISFGNNPVKGSKPVFSKVIDGQYNYNHFELAGKNTLVCERQDMNHATEIFRVDTKKGSATKLTGENDNIYDNLSMGKVESRMVTTSDGKEMLTWVIYPPDFDPNRKYPTLLYCQGGPQSQVSQFYSFRWNFQLMAANDYIIVAPNRRGLPGFGREWNEEISGDWGGQAMRDYLAAIDDVSKENYVDRDNLGCIGASYGGYSVYWLAGNHQGRFGAFVSHCGLFDLENWYLTTEEMFFANEDLGGPYWKDENKDGYARFDPKDFVQNWDTPILVIHGGKDFRVPEAQGMAAFQAAKLRGVPARFLYFPEEGHWVLSPQNGLIWHDQFFKWLDEWLKD